LTDGQDAVGEFLTWCVQAGVGSIAAVQPLHVTAWIELQTQTLSGTHGQAAPGRHPASV
jgi:hypothetical protein